MIATLANLAAVCVLLIPAPMVYVCCGGDTHIDVVQFRGQKIALDSHFRKVHRHCTLDLHDHGTLAHDHGDDTESPLYPHGDGPELQQQTGEADWFWLIPTSRVEGCALPPPPGLVFRTVPDDRGFAPAPWSHSRAPPRLGTRLALLCVHLI